VLEGAVARVDVGDGEGAVGGGLPRAADHDGVAVGVGVVQGRGGDGGQAGAGVVAVGERGGDRLVGVGLHGRLKVVGVPAGHVRGAIEVAVIRLGDDR